MSPFLIAGIVVAVLIVVVVVSCLVVAGRADDQMERDREMLGKERIGL